LHLLPENIQGSNLWSWTEAKAQIYANCKQLAQAIEHHDEKLDIAYQVQRDGKSIWYGESITLCYDKNGKLDTAYGIITDISNRKEKQQQQAEQLELVHRMDATGTLVGGIAHEFNNALAGMNGNVFLIKQSSHDADTLMRIGRIEKLIERSANMIDSMLSFARKGNIQSESICLMDFLNQLQLAAAPSLMGKIELNLQWNASTQSQESMVLADKKKLHEVLMQLVENASLAVADVHLPQITIRVGVIEADDDLLQQYPRLASRNLMHIAVEDNGCGIAAEHKDRIFEPFFSTREIGQGTGLGLSMAYGYINQIGGALDVESSTGSGTTIHIYIPRDEQTQNRPLDKGLISGDGETILVVDDDKIFRESTCEVLRRMGYLTMAARDGAEAIQLFGQHQDSIRLILMDILMPGIRGVQAVKEIRRISETVPVIYLTAYDRSTPMEAEVYEEHAELINKPFRISTLSQTIQKVLKKTDKQFGLFSDHQDS